MRVNTGFLSCGVKDFLASSILLFTPQYLNQPTLDQFTGIRSAIIQVNIEIELFILSNRRQLSLYITQDEAIKLYSKLKEKLDRFVLLLAFGHNNQFKYQNGFYNFAFLSSPGVGDRGSKTN